MVIFSRADDKLARAGYYERTHAGRVYHPIPSAEPSLPVFSMADLQMNELEGCVARGAGKTAAGPALHSRSAVHQSRARRATFHSGLDRRLGSTAFHFLRRTVDPGHGVDGIARGKTTEERFELQTPFRGGTSAGASALTSRSLFGGIGDDEWTTALETSYRSEDRFTCRGRARVSTDPSPCTKNVRIPRCPRVRYCSVTGI